MNQQTLLNNLNSWINIKCTELQKLGYEEITVEDISDYFAKYKWRRRYPDYYYEQVQDIMSLTANQLFDFKTIEIQTNSHINLADLDLELLF